MDAEKNRESGDQQFDGGSPSMCSGFLSSSDQRCDIVGHAALTTRDRAYDEKRLFAGSDRFRQNGIIRVVGHVLFAG
ncbi:MAG TPA: hypothetical protein VFZ51_05945, partial [Woeseiaceae bacterium]